VIKKTCFLLVFFVAIFAYAEELPQDKPYKLTIIHISDSHGHILNFGDKENPGVASPIGILVNKVREDAKKDGSTVLFFHSGDLNTGIPESDILNAKPDIDALNLLGLDAMNVGNHEFDKPAKVLKEQEKEAHFPFLSANASYIHGKDKLAQPYIIKDIDGHKVCIFGLLTSDRTVFTPARLKNINIDDPYTASKEVIQHFPKGCFIIALSHLGVSLLSDDGGDLGLVRTNPEINVVLGGHTHVTFRKPIKRGDTLIIHSYAEAKGLSRLDLEVDSKGIEHYTYTYLTLDKKDSGVAAKEDPKMKELLAGYKEKTNTYFSKEIGNNISTLFLDGSHEKEIAIGDLVADVVMTKGKCDVAVAGPGGIRSSLDKGTIHIRDLYKVYPFGNKILRVSITSDKLMEILKQGYFNSTRKDKKSFLQIAGMKISVANGDVVLKEIKGKAPVEKKKYTLCVDDFLGNGGDGMSVLKDVPDKTNTDLGVRDSLIDYVKHKKTIDYRTDGRISIN